MNAEPELWLLPDALFDGVSLRKNVALGIAKGRSLEIVDQALIPQNAPMHRILGVLTAGYLDLQVNGGGDALLNNDQSPAALRRMASAHRQFGTVGILPTVITDAPDVLSRAVAAVLAAKGDEGLLGIHIEGPHLSIARRGTHATEWVRPFEHQTLHHIDRLRSAGIFVKITVAPESVSPQNVREIVQTGAVVSIGHSDATADETRALLEAGASCFTHLFNAMSPMLNRSPGVTGACINSTAFAGIICDGIHVADEMVGLAIRARPIAGRMFLVSDAMSTVGGSDHFRLYDQDLWLRDGRLVNSEGSLAGAHVTMAEGVARLINVVGIAPEVALAMATTTPAALIRRPELASPAQRSLADLLCLGTDWTVTANLSSVIKDLAA